MSRTISTHTYTNHLYAPDLVQIIYMHPALFKSSICTRPCSNHLYAPGLVQIIYMHPALFKSSICTRPCSNHLYAPGLVQIPRTSPTATPARDNRPKHRPRHRPALGIDVNYLTGFRNNHLYAPGLVQIIYMHPTLFKSSICTRPCSNHLYAPCIFFRAIVQRSCECCTTSKRSCDRFCDRTTGRATVVRPHRDRNRSQAVASDRSCFLNMFKTRNRSQTIACTMRSSHDPLRSVGNWSQRNCERGFRNVPFCRHKYHNQWAFMFCLHAQLYVTKQYFCHGC